MGASSIRARAITERAKWIAFIALEGRTCTIAPFACWNGTRPRAACVCDGTYWRCPEAPCPPRTMLLTESAGRACTNDWACESLLCDASQTRQGFCTGRAMPQRTTQHVTTEQPSINKLPCGQRTVREITIHF